MFHQILKYFAQAWHLEIDTDNVLMLGFCNVDEMVQHQFRILRKNDQFLFVLPDLGNIDFLLPEFCDDLAIIPGLCFQVYLFL